MWEVSVSDWCSGEVEGTPGLRDLKAFQDLSGRTTCVVIVVLVVADISIIDECRTLARN